MDAPVLLGPGEGETIRPRFEIKAGREEVVVTEVTYEPGRSGPDLHVHHHHADAFFVLEGALEIMLGESERVTAEAGAFVLIPPDVVHTFHNPSPRHARYLNFHAPGAGFDEYLRSNFQADFDQHDPPPDGGRPISEAIVRGRGEGERLGLGPSSALIKAGGSEGMGSLGVLETTVAPGFPGPVLHVHDETVDSFYVLEGTLTVRIGDETLEAGAGSYAVVPPGNAHTFSSPGEAPVRFLNVMAPGGLERYLQEVAALPGPADPATMAEIASKYDFRAL
jgi:mannose-6-phosphate isomerase-like protein (cupin superfamily)